MFGTIRKHQTWLWIFIIVAMILGLVVYFGPTTGRGGSGQSEEVRLGSIDGVPITKAEFFNAQRETLLGYFIRSGGSWPDAAAEKSGFDLQRETYIQLLFEKKLKQYNIHVDAESAALLGKNILARFGRGQPIPLDVFVAQALAPRGISGEDFERYLRHYVGLQQLWSVVALGGDLVTSQDAQSLYVREYQEVATEAVFFSGTNYSTSVATPTPAVLAEFYTNSTDAYRLPERVRVSYVSFDATNFLAEADKDLAMITNINAKVDQIYLERGTNYYRDAKTPEEAKLLIRAEMRNRAALGEASRKADAFAFALFDKEPMRAENLAELAKTNGLKVKITAPFDLQNGPTEFDGGPNFAKVSFKLRDDEPFVGPLIGDKAVYVIALANKIPSEVPPLDKIHSKVVADYKQFQATQTAARAGADFARVLTNGLAQGKTFDALCAAGLHKPVKLPPVSRSTRELPQLDDRVSAYQFLQLAMSTEPGSVSDFSRAGDGGVIVYVQQRLPIDPAKMNADMPEFLKAVRQARRNEAINAWLQKEASKAFRDTLMQQTKPSILSGKGKS